MTNFKHATLDISQILLDPINPRHAPLTSQRKLIQAMLDDQKEKLVNLAKDIIREGINPSELIIVVPHNSENDKYIVVEGNRRITALKLLEHPFACRDKKFTPEFKELHEAFSKNPITRIGCVIFPDRESADHWVNLKHTGENNGVGTVRWNATNIRRRTAQQSQSKKPSNGLQLLNFILEKGDLDEKDKALFKKIPITNVERLINDPKVRKFLGLIQNNGEISSSLSLEDTIRILKDFFSPFATKDKRVGDVYHKADREKYLNELGVPPSDDASKAASNWPLGAPPAASPKPDNPSPRNQKSPLKKSRPSSTSRKTLIPASCIMSIKHPRINDIYRELKRLDIDDFRNAGAALLRVFLELSLDEYIEAKKIQLPKNDYLRNKIQCAADYLVKEAILTKNEAKPARDAANKPHGLFSASTLHAYIHNPVTQPKPSEIKLTWDEMELFMQKLWE